VCVCVCVCEVLYVIGTLPNVSTSNLFSPFTTLAVTRETGVLEKRRITAHVCRPVHNLGFINSSHITAFRFCTFEEMYFAVPWNRLTAMLLMKLHTSAACIKWILLYTGCPGGNVPDFGRMFLKLKYTDITQNTYSRSWTVTDIMAREKCGCLAVPPTLPGSRDVLLYTAHVRPAVYSRVKRTHTATAHVKCLEP